MTAGTYVGRVGGLALALGIGAGILAGAGAAFADDDAGSGPGTSASDTSASGTSASDTSATKPSKTIADSDRGTGSSTDTEVAERDQDDTADDADSAASQRRSAKPTRVSTRIADDTATDTDTEVATDTDEAPSDADDSPAVPGAVALSALATARDKTEDAGAADNPAPATVAAGEYEIPTDVVVTEVTAPLEWMQYVPVLGRFVVTPIVNVIHAIPFVSEILHPLVGWPVDHDAPPGAPRPRTVRVRSFDGAEIYVHFMPATGLRDGESAPTVLNGPGVGFPGSTTLGLDVDPFLPGDIVGIGMLRKAGYNVVSWDPRGEWRSGGRMQLQSPDFEGRDVSHIISWLTTLDAVAKVDGDPKIGMVGLSYGGGIQFSSAIVDHRIDAIVPTIAWNSLVDAIFPRQAVSSVWGTFLSALLVITGARPNERILPAVVGAVLTGRASQSDIDLFNSRMFADRLAKITAPTLLVQGTVDTLVPLSHADLNARALLEAGTTTKVVWFCGGHGTCLSSVNDGKVVWRETMEWLDRYVKGDESVDPGPQFEWVDQHGDWHSSPTYPVAAGESISAELTGTGQSLAFVPFLGGSGPNPLILTRGLVRTFVGLPSGAKAFNAVNLRVPDATELTHLVGAPELTLTYSGTGNAKHVYAQIVDDETGLVLGNQVTPIPVVLDGQSRTVTFTMEQIGHTLRPGESVTVQLLTSAFSFLNFYSYGGIKVEGMSVKLPTLAAAQVITTAA